MANTVYDQPGSAYDQDSNVGHDGQRAAGKPYDPRGHDTPSGNASDPRDEINQAERNPDGNGNGPSPKAVSPSGLKNGEESGLGGENADTDSAGNEDTGDDGLYNAGGDQPRSRIGRARQRYRNLLNRALKNKWLAGAGLGGIGIIALIIIILILLTGAYKVVDFAEHVAAYQFARVTRQMAESTDTITAEKVGIDVADKGVVRSTYNNIKSKYYDTASGKVKDLWSKFDQYRPQKIISNFGHDGTLTFNYRDGRFGRQILDSVTINGEEVSITRGTAKNLIPGYKFAKDISFSKDFAPNLNDALKANDIGPITRAKVASQIRQELGISLTAWLAGKYSGKSQADAAAQVEEDTLAVAEGSENPTNSNVAGRVNDAATSAKSAEDAAVQDPKKLADIVNSGGAIPSDVIDSINSSFSTALFSSVQSFISNIVGLVNPVYKYATPLCLIYDGSLVNSGPTIDNQSQQLERSAVWVQSASAQEKDGFNASGEAVGATDWKLGDITKSNAEGRANGLPADTGSSASVEASPTGQYSIADYGLGSTLGGIVDAMAGPICPVATNIWLGIGLGAVGVFLTPGVGTASDGVVDTATQTLGGQIIDRLIATSAAGKDAISKVFSWDTVKTLGVIGVGTVVAKMLVMSQMGATHNSLATGQSYDNDVDNGTNIYANQVEQRQFYGAPMSDGSLAQDNTANQASLALKQSRQSAFNRYLAVSNPDSLLSRAAIMASSYLNRSFFASMFKAGSGLFDPLRSFGSILNPLVSHTSFAAASVTSANTYYGNVQFGYTPEEEGLIHDSSLTYGDALENQYALDQSGKEDEINTTYGKCFDGSVSIGDLLSKGYIKRNKNGDVLADDSLCSPKTLGPHNPKYGDLVFRWRLANNYNNTLDQLNQEQDITAGGAAGGSGSSGSVDQGSASQLAQKLLDYKKTGRYNCDNPGDCTDLQKVVSGQSLAGSSGCQAKTLDPRVIQLLLYLIESGNFKVGTYAMCGDHSFDSPRGHSGGFAVDISSVNGVAINQDTQAAATQGVAMDKFLNNLPTALQLNQQISYGYGNHPYQPMADLQQADGKLCTSSCVSFYTLAVEQEHENHIHAGF